MGATFAICVLVLKCALNTFLPEVWINGVDPFEAFDTVINSLLQTIIAGKAADFIIDGGIEMIKYMKYYAIVRNQFPMKNKARNKAKGPSKWAN
ncbi:MAG: hypothetical protein OXU23_04065 [Candidatus Poribacteria bacterium]|nr:hypothetical protein [Candidatus Poribacteria bacterium]